MRAVCAYSGVVPPFQGFVPEVSRGTQGVALGWYVAAFQAAPTHKHSEIADTCLLVAGAGVRWILGSLKQYHRGSLHVRDHRLVQCDS